MTNFNVLLPTVSKKLNTSVINKVTLFKSLAVHLLYKAIYLRIKHYLEYQKRVKSKLKYIIEQYTGCNIKIYTINLKKLLKKTFNGRSPAFLLGYTKITRRIPQNLKTNKQIFTTHVKKVTPVTSTKPISSVKEDLYSTSVLTKKHIHKLILKYSKIH
jgi:hypothetical protein